MHVHCHAEAGKRLPQTTATVLEELSKISSAQTMKKHPQVNILCTVVSRYFWPYILLRYYDNAAQRNPAQKNI